MHPEAVFSYHGAMPRAVVWIASFGALLFLVGAAWMGRLERTGPAHADLQLDGGIPATFYLPGDAGFEAFLDPPPVGERPPAVVLMHGFASDRLGLSTLARRLARRGYAVLSFDAPGHGQNRHAFPHGRGRPDAFADSLRAAVDHLRAVPAVDGERIAVMGHSMGAGASLDFATRDAGIAASVMISGGWTTQGPYRPPDALFIYASGDPAGLKQRSDALAAKLAGVERVEPGRSYGDAARGDAVRVVEVPGVDHASIVWSAEAAGEIADWLDAAFGRERGGDVAGDPRQGAALLIAFSLLLVLPGLGGLLGRLAPAVPERPARGIAVSVAWLVGALFVSMPLVSVETPTAVLSVEVGDVVVGHFLLAGLALLAALALRGDAPLALLRVAPARTLAVAALGVVAVYALLLPISVVVHRMTLTPERGLVFLGASVGLLPLSLAQQALLRRGAPLRSALASALGRAVVLATLLLGVASGVLSFVVVLMLPSLVLVFVLFELLADGIYATSRNVGVIAVIDAAWLALVIAAVMPVRA